MAALAGKGGAVKIDTTAAAYVESWELSISDEVYDATGLGATSKAKVPHGLPENSWSITWKACDMSDASTLAFLTAIQAGTSIKLNLFQDGSKYWKMETAYVTGFTTGATVDGLVTGSAEGTCDGNPAYT
jgi:hypothetical protein